MPLDQVLLTLLALALIANAFLLASVPLGARRRRITVPAAAPAPVPLDSVNRLPATEDERTAKAIEAFVGGVSSPGMREQAGRSPVAAAEPDPPRRSIRESASDGNGRIDRPTRAAPDGPTAGHEPAAAFLDAEAWDRAVREESARFARFGRPVTVVSIELAGLSRLASGLGPEVADRVANEAAGALVSVTRAADHIAWLDTATFAALLLETDGPAASAYVERARESVDGWLDSAGLAVGLSVGWATPEETGDLAAAVAMAEQRMHADDGRPQPLTPGGR
jgi:GGDEF domain-containing protein